MRRKTTMRSKKSARFTPSFGVGATGAIVVGVLVVAMFMGSGRRSSSAVAMAATDASIVSASKPASTGASTTLPARSEQPKPVVIAKDQAPAASVMKPSTLTGCLMGDGATFRLTDTGGTEAPKSRSWKSGFLKKSSPSIDLVDANNGLKLSTQVGHRVKVTGPLANHEMRVRSLQRLNGSCN